MEATSMSSETVSAEDSPTEAVPEEDDVSDEEATPTEELAIPAFPQAHSRTTSDATLAPPSPITPDPGVPLSPHNYHNRFLSRKLSKGSEEMPQWPLPFQPDIEPSPSV